MHNGSNALQVSPSAMLKGGVAVLILALAACQSIPTTTSAGASNSTPLVAAHRGGNRDGPENTIPTLQNSLKYGADILWITVQASSDGVPVLYRPADVSALTDGNGPVNTLTAAQLTALNAGYQYSETDTTGNKRYPYRQHPIKVPTLREVLHAVPATVPIIIDMKQLPADKLVNAVTKVMAEESAWSRIRFYSTDATVNTLMAKQPKAQLFESRNATRDRLVRIALNGGACNTPPAAGTWSGIELVRKVSVVEKFTLGEGVSEVVAHWWTPAAMKCFKKNPGTKVMVFGVDSAAAYRSAQLLGVDVVMTDSPMKVIEVSANKPRTEYPD
jgi:glycerophosphoryl diester phosphodiesterase